jgi:hypothetical protein
MPSPVAAPPRSASIAISAPTAAIRPSPTTRAATGTAPSARPTLANSGFASGSRNCCLWATITWVFSVPHALVPLMWQNQRRLFALLFEASAATLLEVTADPRHLGARIGLLSILHLGTDPPISPPISTASCPAPAYHRITLTGYLLRLASSCPSRYSAAFSAASSLLDYDALSSRSVAVLRRVLAADRRDELRRFSQYSVPAGLGRLCQAALRRTRARVALSGSLHPSHRHLQPPPALGLRYRGSLPLEGLRMAVSSAP